MGSVLNVLMLEDSEADAGLVLYHLRSGGFDVRYRRMDTAAEFEAALQQGTWDVVLSDYSMPGFNGMEAFSILKESGVDIPFVIISGTIGEEIAVAAMRHGVHDYLIKDKLARLPVAVARVLQEAVTRREQKQLQSLIAMNERRYKSIFNSANVSLWEVDLLAVSEWLQERHLVSVELLLNYLASQQSYDVGLKETAARATIFDINHTTYNMFNLAADTQLPSTLLACWPAPLIAAWEAILVALVGGQQSLQTEGFLHTADGKEQYFLISLIIPRDKESLKNVVVSFYDVTEKRQMEYRIIASQRMEAVGQLAGGVAHDFNNLLTVILSGAEILQEDFNGVISARNELQQIRRAAERAAKLTQQLLAFSRNQAVQAKVLHVQDATGDMLKIIQKLLGAHIKIVVKQPLTPLYIKADVSQLEQIILNLAVNARDAMADGGTFTLQIDEVAVDHNLPSVTGTVPLGKYLCLKAIDSGTGIPREILPHLFEPFFTTKAPGKGTGLGLATVYGNVQQNKGYITVESELGVGSVFTVYFPLLLIEGGIAQQQQGIVTVAKQGKETILLVEDELMVRDAAKQILERQGYQLLVAGDGKEALEIAAKYQGSIDLLMTDMIMPEMGGKALQEQFSKLYPHTTVLFMTGYSSDTLEESHFILKPFLRDELLAAVRDALSN
jgi:two-component system, cell cycle sensor histidine kinase and response regulator CckA